ncbi:MAG: hypothetical protein WA705_24820 [Candidatus Ozemobacteraceae bacterium]
MKKSQTVKAGNAYSGNRGGSGLLWLISLTLIISSTLLVQQSGRLVDLLARQRKAFQELKRGDIPRSDVGSSFRQFDDEKISTNAQENDLLLKIETASATSNPADSLKK